MLKKPGAVNPPQPGETPIANVRNAMALLGPLEEEPTVYGISDSDALQMVKAALVRLRAVEEQLLGKK